MKYLVYASYAGFSLDDPEDMATNSWILGIYDNERDIISAANDEFEQYIEDQVCNRFEFDDPDLDLEEVEDFKNRFEVSIYSNRKDQLNEASLVGALWLDGEYYFESVKVYTVKLED